MNKQPVLKQRRVKKVCMVLAVTFLSYVLVSMAGAAVVFRFIFTRVQTVQAFELTYADIDSASYPRREVSFFSGENRLYGYVYSPAGASKGLVLLLNGMNCCIDRHLPEILYFVDHGFTVFTFENTGVGRSEGSGTVGLAQARLDAAAAVGYLQTDSALALLPLVVYGHSLGGYAAAEVLSDAACVRAAVCVSAFDSPNENMRFSAKKYVGVLADLQYPFMCLQNYFLFGGQSSETAVSAINSSQKPVMIVGGCSDTVVPDEISIIGKADAIINPNAVTLKICDAYRGGHSTVWLSQSAAKYLAETEAPDDKQRANELDEDFMQRVIGFYHSALE